MQYEFECAKSSEIRYIISHFPCNLSGGQSWNKTHELYMGINALQNQENICLTRLDQSKLWPFDFKTRGKPHNRCQKEYLWTDKTYFALYANQSILLRVSKWWIEIPQEFKRWSCIECKIIWIFAHWFSRIWKCLLKSIFIEDANKQSNVEKFWVKSGQTEIYWVKLSNKF